MFILENFNTRKGVIMIKNKVIFGLLVSAIFINGKISAADNSVDNTIGADKNNSLPRLERQGSIDISADVSDSQVKELQKSIMIALTKARELADKFSENSRQNRVVSNAASQLLGLVADTEAFHLFIKHDDFPENAERYVDNVNRVTNSGENGIVHNR